jgi:hypothetical protein
MPGCRVSYLFDPEQLHEISNSCVGLPHDEMVQTLIDRVAEAHPGHVETKQDWFFNITSGATGIMTVLHASISEYVIVFGTPIGTEAFSGRYPMDIWDFMLEGEMWTYTPQNCRNRCVTLPGEYAVLPRGQTKGFKLPEGAWMLEYGRGIVPLSLPLVLGDVVVSAMDIPTLMKTLRVYGRLAVKELLKGKI